MTLALVLALAAAGAIVPAWLDHGQVWLLPDSVSYLGAASNLIGGHGLTVPFRATTDPFTPVVSSGYPLIHWPPGYPIQLALLELIGVKSLLAAQLWNMVAAGALVMLAAAIGWRATSHRSAAAVCAGLVLISAAILQNGRFALSDLTFVVLVAAAVWAAADTLEGSPSARRVLIATVCAATTVKWLGLALCVPAALAASLGARDRPLRAAAAQLSLPAAWVVVLAALSAHAPRALSWHPVLTLGILLQSVGSWLAPPSAGPELLLGVGVTASVLVGLLLLHTLILRRSHLRLVLLVTLGVLLAGLLLTRLLLDATVPWDDRILSPLLLVLIALGVEVAFNESGWLRYGAAGVMLALAVMQALGWSALISAAPNPVGYTSAYWRQVPTASVRRALSGYLVLASNRPDVMYFRIGRSALSVPKRFDPESLQVNRSLPLQLSELRHTLADRGALVVFLDPTNPRPYLAGTTQLIHALGLLRVASFPHTQIYVESVVGHAGRG